MKENKTTKGRMLIIILCTIIIGFILIFLITMMLINKPKKEIKDNTNAMEKHNEELEKFYDEKFNK